MQAAGTTAERAEQNLAMSHNEQGYPTTKSGSKEYSSGNLAFAKPTETDVNDEMGSRVP